MHHSRRRTLGAAARNMLFAPVGYAAGAFSFHSRCGCACGPWWSGRARQRPSRPAAKLCTSSGTASRRPTCGTRPATTGAFARQLLFAIADWNFPQREEVRDSRLSARGRDQAARLQNVVPGLGVELVVVSPMTRALQTACIAFQHTDTPMVPWPAITEFFTEACATALGSRAPRFRTAADRAQDPANQGRNAAELSSSEDLTALPRFSTLRKAHLPSEWWHVAPDRARLRAFLRWLEHAPEHRIAVVAHWGFIRYVLDEACFDEDLELNNACLVETLWEAAGAAAPAAMHVARLVPAEECDAALLRQAREFAGECRADAVLRHHAVADLAFVLGDPIALPAEPELVVAQLDDALLRACPAHVPARAHFTLAAAPHVRKTLTIESDPLADLLSGIYGVRGIRATCTPQRCAGASLGPAAAGAARVPRARVPALYWRRRRCHGPSERAGPAVSAAAAPAGRRAARGGH